jgi:hypothetical protein
MYVPVGLGRMVKSRRYRAWIDKNLPLVLDQIDPAERFPVRIDITIVGGRDWHEGMDPDNASKPIMDLLVRARVIPDDSGKYVECPAPRFMPFGRNGEALTKISYTEPDQPETDWN